MKIKKVEKVYKPKYAHNRKKREKILLKLIKKKALKTNSICIWV